MSDETPADPGAPAGGSRPAADVGSPPNPGTAPASSPVSALLMDLVKPPAGEATPTPGPGDRVADRFEVVRELGRGGFGVVLEARDALLGRAVALKFIRPGKQLEAPDAPAIAEGEAVSRLSHPNIVQIFDRGTCQAGPFLVLELLEGEPLSRRIQRGPLGAAEATRMALGVARGLAHAHVRGVIHRDLKPGNVFLCSDGQVKVLDFGLAHLVGRAGKFDGGTPGWLAPEQRRGLAGDERTDVWALGAILFRALAGQDPSSSRLSVPGAPELEALVEVMLSPDPAGRPRDASRIVEALEPVARRLGEPTRAEPPRPPGQPGGSGQAGAVLPREGEGSPPKARNRRTRLAVLLGLGAAAAVAALVFLVWSSTGRRPAEGPGAVPAAAGEPSVAVLPFADLSPQHDQDYFSDGIAEEILNVLAQVEGLRVIGRTSSFTFKGKGDDLRSISAKLGVGNVLEGSVRTQGGRIRVTAQLVRASDGSHVWSDRYDRDLKDVFAVQDEVARAVVEALKVKLLPGRDLARPEGRSTSPAAHQQYLLARGVFLQGPRSFRLAEAEFQKAIALDPGYAPAWAFLARVQLFLSSEEKTQERVIEAQQRALATSEKAIALDPTLADGYVSRHMVEIDTLDFSGAEADADRAIALNPGYPAGYFARGNTLLTLGRVREAIAAFRKAAALDPLYARPWVALVEAHLSLGETASVRAAVERVRELRPGQEIFWNELGTASLLDGKPAEALASYQRDEREWVRLTGAALALHSLGQAAEARQALQELTVRLARTSGYQIAEVYAWRGEPDAAFEWLERAYRERDAGLTSLKHDPLLRNLRGDPRYTALLRKLKLPVE